MPEDRYYGYQFRSRQPCAIVDQQLALGTLEDTRNIDSWLTDYFLVDISNIPKEDNRQGNGQDRLALAAANRALVLYGELVRASGMPSYDHGRVLRVSAADETQAGYRATIALPVIDTLPLDLFAQVFRASTRLVLRTLSQEPSPEAARDLFAQLDEAIIAHAKKFSPFSWTTLPVCELAHQQNLPWRHIGRGVVRLGWGAKSQLLHHSSIERDSAVGAQLCGSKSHTVRLLRSAGFPVPEHRQVDSLEGAVEAARELGWPVVVKPEHEARSEGVTIDVDSEETLQPALRKAQENGSAVLIERQVPGICNRITVAGDRVIYVIRRLPKGVRGNGRSTVSELVEKANAGLGTVPPWKRLKEFPLDDLALESLAKQGLTPQSVPAEDQWVNLRPLSNDDWGGSIEDLTDHIHPDNARLAIDAVRMFGLKIAGVDLMTTDISRPWHENGAVILELNFMPQIRIQKREEHAARLMPALMGGDGRIPVHLVTGQGDLPGEARRLRSQLESQGRKCHLTSSDRSEDAAGREIVMTASGLFERSLALIMRRDVHELILVGALPEVLNRGLAVDRLENALVVDDDPERGERAAREIASRFPVRSCRRLSPEIVPIS
ncbi:MAG: acetate--CoA ligase family protein [Novosphingobium sp.]|nr:acetate--CoA ligase family protein [Novosphingobium sp.]